MARPRARGVPDDLASASASAHSGHGGGGRVLRRTRVSAREGDRPGPRPGSANHAAARDYIFNNSTRSDSTRDSKDDGGEPTAAPLFFAAKIQNIVAPGGKARRRGVPCGWWPLRFRCRPGQARTTTAPASRLCWNGARAERKRCAFAEDVIFLFTDSEETGCWRSAVCGGTRLGKGVEVLFEFRSEGKWRALDYVRTRPGTVRDPGAVQSHFRIRWQLAYIRNLQTPAEQKRHDRLQDGRLPGMNSPTSMACRITHPVDNVENVDAGPAASRILRACAQPQLCAAVSAVNRGRRPLFQRARISVGALSGVAGLAADVGRAFFVCWRGAAWILRKKLKGVGDRKGALLFFVSLIAAAGGSLGRVWLVRRFHPGYSLIAQGDS